MYHSVTFSTAYSAALLRNTWDDWHLIPTSRPTVGAAEPQITIDDSPMTDSGFDMTEALTQELNKNYRTGSFEFMLDNDFRPWFEIYSEIMDFLHGQFGEMRLEDDILTVYEGRFFVEEFRSEKHWSYITIGYRLEP